MPKRLTAVPPLYVQRHELSKRLTVYCFLMFLLLNLTGYLFYDASDTLIDSSETFIEECDGESTFNADIKIDFGVGRINSYDDVEGKGNEKVEERINRKYCGKSECRFLFAYYQPEQETKANMHFRSFVNLAQTLGRTMVLTNVGNSRINSCQNFTFGFYYNAKALENMFPDVRFISQRDFQDWLRERRRKPNAEHAHILPGGSNYSMELMTPYPDILRTKNCLDRFDFRLDDRTVFKQFNTGPNFSKSIETHTAFSEFLVENLRTDAEVLLTSHFVFHPLFPNVSKPIPYGNHYFEEASKITDRIKPYVAIHWRMERANIGRLPECAEALVRRVTELKESQGIRNVYLATDYPITGGKTQSQTFHLLTENHHEAMRMMNSTFDVHTWVTSKIFAHLRNDEIIEKEFLGAGMPGIVDKLVCMDADYFLATPEGCGRMQSTYTTMIINSRSASMESGDKPQLKNIVERWIQPTEEQIITRPV